MMLHLYLNYNNFHYGHKLALLVVYNKIYILIYWDECSIKQSVFVSLIIFLFSTFNKEYIKQHNDTTIKK